TGDGTGLADTVSAGARHGVRTPMQWTPDRNAGFSRADPQRLYLQPIMDPMYGFEAVNVETQLRDKSSLLHWTRRMLAVRKTSRAFGRGRRTFLKPGNRKILAYLSEHDDDVILSVFNLSRAAQPVELDLSAFKGRVPVEMLGRTSFPPIGELPYLLTLNSHGFYWFRLTNEVAMPSWHQEGVALQDRPVLVLFDGWTSLFKERVMPWRIGFADRLRGQFETDTLPRHIEAQRWYASKGAAIERAVVADHAIWQAGGQSWMLPILDLQGPPAPSVYFMPLALAWEDREEERMKSLTPAALAKIRQQADVGVMGDAFFDEAFCRQVVRAIAADSMVATAHGRLHFRPTSLGRELVLDQLDELAVSRPSAMSSNTVVTIGDQLFLKGYRQLRPGVNPELEMGRFLTEVVQFPNCVPVAGAIEYAGDDGTVMTLGLLQAYVPNQGDGWEYTLAYLERFLSELRDMDGDATAQPHGAFLALIHILGQRTAELHTALAQHTGDPDFDPVPLADDDLLWIRDNARTEAQQTLDLLNDRLNDLPPASQDDARRLLARSGDVQAYVDGMQVEGRTGLRTRFHGDYHLGQVLVARNDFLIIDFEGEPARSLDERRAKRSPLRDVAGMLRSFNYARWSALRRAAQNADELARMDAAARTWEQETRDAFLAGYSGSLAPAAGAVDPELLALFELEKAMYELRYEIGNRIDWVPVPLQGILALLDRSPRTRSGMR
ncbi:MAG: putative maltokinase, partial [Variovorax sp.]